MNLQEAITKANVMLDEGVSRSHVCSFINELASAKLITNAEADYYADILAADRGNNVPVLRSLSRVLTRRMPTA